MSDESEIVVATAADEGYAIPLAVTLRSAVSAMRPETKMRLVVLDGGITPESRGRLMAAVKDPRVRVDWLLQDTAVLDGLPVFGHVTVAAYLRLLLPKILPTSIERVIYLDSDMLVRRDLSDLWAESQDDAPILAVQDIAAPWMNSEVVADNYAQRFPYLAAAKPVANYEQLGIRPEAPYFNSGLLVMNLTQWREEQIAEQVMQCLIDQHEHVLWWDQYALNVVLADRWRALDFRWNQGAHVYAFPSWRQSPVGRDAFNQLRCDPWIVHFCSPEKPWHAACGHPFRREFFATLDTTPWRGWRSIAKPGDRGLIARQHRRKLKNTLHHSLLNASERVRELWKRAS
ncbi:glycosyltransferase family 8 protein [Botrimarina hoheduenensis]|uniref:General stress protein A n=1 Tax=Botrimarina hoheduenensis TaxID=2528000 RepID=A0A5C5W934_9BACT|nr:glycosyltransferase family 8 protein [Botrimarina hoheduenensis]TWT47396.1 General stress protein A [Botrimarina hoheduenensis]